MTPALSLTGADLVRALARLRERPSVDQAVAERAEALAREIEADGEGQTRVMRRGPSDYAVTVARLDEAAK